MALTRQDVLRFRVHAHELDADGARSDARVLDLGVQDTGPDGAAWALALRGCEPDPATLLHAWSLRGAPHVYRRSEAAQVAAAVAPLSEDDAAKRIFDGSKPLRAAGVAILDALDRAAGEMRDHASSPRTKGEMSAELTRRLERPYLRDCGPCGTVHVYEQTLRLAALRGGLELDPGTSPPVLRRIPGWRGPAARVPEHLDVVRGVLRLLGPSTPRLVAGFLDAAVKDVTAHWPRDVETVEVDGTALQVLAGDRAALADPPEATGVRLLGPFDLFLQGRDRELLVPDEAARKDVWRPLGRPGSILDGAELVGTWRPRAQAGKLRLAVETWSGAALPPGLEEQAERLAAFRGVSFAGWV